MASQAVLTRKMRHSRRAVYIALEDDFNFIWDARDVEAVEHMWREGLSIIDMANALDRDGDEVAVLLIDLIRQGRISKRRGGWLGNRKGIPSHQRQDIVH